MIKKLYFFPALILFVVLLTACQPEIILPEDHHHNEVDITLHSYLTIKGNQKIVFDCTPEMTILTEKEDICLMSFSGNGIDWSEWVDYTENYEQFNIANGLNGTTRESGIKAIYVRFKDMDGFIFPEETQEPVCCIFEYEMQDLFSVKIDPTQVQVKVGESQNFVLRGYDLKLNEVPLDPVKVEWSKPCDVGKLNPTTGIQTTYTAPEMPGVRNISAHYNFLGTGAKIYILDDNE